MGSVAEGVVRKAPVPVLLVRGQPSWRSGGIGKILVPESPANLCFGGPDGKTLYITARKSLYSIPTSVKDARARM